jgi:Flp pilus assembly protein TadD
MRVATVAAVLLVASCGGQDAPAPAPPPPPVAHTGSAAASAVAPKSALVEGGAVRPHHEEPVVECPVDIPESADDDTRLSALLDAANAQLDAVNYPAAWTCADRASDLAPQSVEAHHVRAAALAAMGRDSEAQLAYALALALDPDDPETLRAVADFYINGKGEHGRDAVRLGLELAVRGSRRAATRRHRAPGLAADLALLEAQALDDLGRSDEALVRVDAALRLAPGRADALHEKGVALFDLSRFAEAKAVLTKAVALQPDDAYTHQMLGLAEEGLGEQAVADTELSRAVQLAPTELTPPVTITPDEFQHEVDAVIATLPEARRAHVAKTKIEITDLPLAADLSAVSPPFPPTILGLYRGPVGHAATEPPQPGDEPVSIVLYRKNLARAVKTRTELTEQIRDTLLHEIGHLEGLDEDDLRRRGME